MTQKGRRLPSEEEAEREYDIIPRDSHELIALLDEAYPHACIKPNQTPEEAHRYAGARALVDEMLAERDRALAVEAETEAEKAKK